LHAEHGIREEQFIRSQQVLWVQRTLVDLDAVGDRQVDHLCAHDTAYATIGQGGCVQHTVTYDEEVTGTAFDDVAALIL